MAINTFKEFAVLNNWEIVKNYAYGEVSGYMVTLVGSQGSKSFCIPLTSIDEGRKQHILQYLKDNKKGLKLLEFKFFGDTLFMKFNEGFKGASVKDMENLLNSIVNFLKEINFENKNCCTFCGREDAFDKTYIDGIRYYCHTDCYTSAAMHMDEASVEYNEQKKNYLTGSVGALLGGLVFSIPWILVQVFFQKIAAVLACLIAFGALTGYTLLRGKLGKLTRWIIAICTLISVVVSEAGIVVIELVKEGIPIDGTTLHLLLHSDEIMSAIRSDLIMGLFMAILGIIPVFSRLKGDAKNVLPTISK